MGFILSLNEAIQGKKLSEPCEDSSSVKGLLDVLDTLWRWVDETPPSKQTLRYGNPAYRTWFQKMEDGAQELLQKALPPSLYPATTELAPYFTDSFGNATRIDYGTGHETNFVALLFCLARLGAVGRGDRQALMAHVFVRYLDLMRKVQTTYWLEPAGSHGVWGLDDYHFLPFIWGSAQLVGHPVLRPRSIHNDEILKAYSGEYMYLAAVQFVKKVKKGPLAETSPMLNDISGVPNWAKVNSGLIKMYQAEVLAKLPIMQHFRFGSLIPWEEGHGETSPAGA